MKPLLYILTATIAPFILCRLVAAQDSGALSLAQGAAQLQTQPRSIEQSQPLSNQSPDTRSSTELENATGTLQANPARPAPNSIIPAGFIPAELLRPRAPKPVDPLEFFKVPPLDGGIKVPLGR
jgi:hypothetical protein